MIESLFETKQDMLPSFSFAQIKFSPAPNYYLTMFYKFFQNTFERDGLWHSINQGHQVDVESFFELSVFIESI